MKWEEIFNNYAVETLEFIKSGKNVAITQGQLYIEELIKWEIYSGISIATLGAVGCYLSFRLFNYGSKKEKADPYNESPSVAMFSGAILLVFFVVPLICGAGQASKAYLAPRVMIMEKLQASIK